MKGNTERNQEIADRYVFSNDSLRTVGAEFGITGEWVRQIVGGLYSRAELRRLKVEACARYEQGKTAAILAEAEKHPCGVCGKPNVRAARSARSRTCSPDCAAAWKHYAWYADPQREAQHRYHCARSVLRRPDKYGPSRIARAELIVRAWEAGESLPPKNRTMTPYSKYRRAS